MCRSDVTMVTYDWVEGLDDPYPNFNAPHQCRDLEKILGWVEDRRIYLPQSKLIRQEGDVDLPSNPWLYFRPIGNPHGAWYHECNYKDV